MDRIYLFNRYRRKVLLHFKYKNTIQVTSCLISFYSKNSTRIKLIAFLSKQKIKSKDYKFYCSINIITFAEYLVGLHQRIKRNCSRGQIFFNYTKIMPPSSYPTKLISFETKVQTLENRIPNQRTKREYKKKSKSSINFFLNLSPLKIIIYNRGYILFFHISFP